MPPSCGSPACSKSPLKLPAAQAAAHMAPFMYLCPLIRERRLGLCQQRPTCSSVLTRPAYLLQPERSRHSSVQPVTRLLFFLLSFKSFILVITSAQHHQADMWKPHRCCVVGSAGTASVPLLFLTTLISPLTTLFPSQETTEVVSLFTTCLQEIWVLLLSGMLVLLPSIEKGFADLFLTLQTQTPPLSVRCFHLRFSLTKT